MPQKFSFLDDSRLNTLQEVFHGLFEAPCRTRLEGGALEPLYRPAGDDEGFHTIEFTQDYFSSALHEIAHWCIAGLERRKQLDYGYWYAPDGRSVEQQKLFETVEVKPQAVERILSFACDQKFRVSADNLQANFGASEQFLVAIHTQTLEYCLRGLPSRAHELAHALAKAFGRPNPLELGHYKMESLR